MIIKNWCSTFSQLQLSFCPQTFLVRKTHLKIISIVCVIQLSFLSSRLHWFNDDIVFSEESVTHKNSAVRLNTKRHGKYFHKMLKQKFAYRSHNSKAMFASSAHSDEYMDKAIITHSEALKSIIS